MTSAAASARSQSAICSALDTVADSPTMRVPVSLSRIRDSSASRTGPRAGSPSMWTSSTTSAPAPASVSRSEAIRQMASNFSVVDTHRSACAIRSLSTAYSPDSRSTRSP